MDFFQKIYMRNFLGGGGVGRSRDIGNLHTQEKQKECLKQRRLFFLSESCWMPLGTCSFFFWLVSFCSGSSRVWRFPRCCFRGDGVVTAVVWVFQRGKIHRRQINNRQLSRCPLPPPKKKKCSLPTYHVSVGYDESPPMEPNMLQSSKTNSQVWFFHWWCWFLDHFGDPGPRSLGISSKVFLRKIP